MADLLKSAIVVLFVFLMVALALEGVRSRYYRVKPMARKSKTPRIPAQTFSDWVSAYTPSPENLAALSSSHGRVAIDDDSRGDEPRAAFLFTDGGVNASATEGYGKVRGRERRTTTASSSSSVIRFDPLGGSQRRDQP